VIRFHRSAKLFASGDRLAEAFALHLR